MFIQYNIGNARLKCGQEVRDLQPQRLHPLHLQKVQQNRTYAPTQLCDDHYWQHPCVKDQYQPSQHVGPDKKRQEYYCSLASCKKKLFTVNHYYCEKCRKLFCLPHRMPEEHQCRKGSHKLAEHQGESCKLI